jgi:hypothetical protein
MLYWIKLKGKAFNFFYYLKLSKNMLSFGLRCISLHFSAYNCVEILISFMLIRRPGGEIICRIKNQHSLLVRDVPSTQMFLYPLFPSFSFAFRASHLHTSSNLVCFTEQMSPSQRTWYTRARPHPRISNITNGNNNYRRYQWPCGLRLGPMAARLLGLWVRIPPGAWMSVSCECRVLSGRDICDGLVPSPEESYRVWCV